MPSMLPLRPVVRGVVVGAQVKLEVSSRNRGRFKATVVHDGNTLSTTTDELTISPIAQEVYYEVRAVANDPGGCGVIPWSCRSMAAADLW